MHMFLTELKEMRTKTIFTVVFLASFLLASGQIQDSCKYWLIDILEEERLLYEAKKHEESLYLEYETETIYQTGESKREVSKIYSYLGRNYFLSDYIEVYQDSLLTLSINHLERRILILTSPPNLADLKQNPLVSDPPLFDGYQIASCDEETNKDTVITEIRFTNISEQANRNSPDQMVYRIPNYDRALMEVSLSFSKDHDYLKSSKSRILSIKYSLVPDDLLNKSPLQIFHDLKFNKSEYDSYQFEDLRQKI